jgi:hypothetical protein
MNRKLALPMVLIIASLLISAMSTWAEEPPPFDIKPGSCPNPLNVKSKGVLPVAILGAADFDVTRIDLSTVLLLKRAAPLRSSEEDVAAPVPAVRDVAAPFNGKFPEDCLDCTELGPDGFDDLTLKFDTQDIFAAIGDVEDGDCVDLTITGYLLDGTPFEFKDTVIILKKGRP